MFFRVCGNKGIACTVTDHRHLSIRLIRYIEEILWARCEPVLYHILVPVKRILGNTAAGGVIDEKQTESFAITVVPFEIVCKRPVEIALDIGAVLNCPAEGIQVAGQKIDALYVVDFTVQIDAVIAAETIFCDIAGQRIALI